MKTYHRLATTSLSFLVAMAGLLIIGPAVAMAGNLCLQYATSLCVDYPDGSAQMQVDNGVTYAFDTLGNVSSKNEFPFTGGSGWNARYNGSYIYEGYIAGTSACIGDSGAVNGNAKGIYPYFCHDSLNDPPDLLWVGRGNWLVNVYDTDHVPSSGDPWILESGCASHGCKVWSNSAGQASATDEDWNYPLN